MRSEVKTYAYPDGNIQRVQTVSWEDWSGLDFLSPTPTGDALDCFAHIYRNFLVPQAPWMFGHLVMFRLPENLPELSFRTKKYGTLSDPLTAAAAALTEGLRIVSGKPRFRSAQAKALWEALEKENCLRIISGKLPVTTIIPVGNFAGYLSRSAPDAPLKVNSSFFIMDRFDCATVYDQVGTPFGLSVKNGIAARPPLYHREALLVKKDGSVSVEPLDVSTLGIEINGQVFRHGENARIYSRPRRSRSPGGLSAVIVGNRVVAVGKGRLPVPASGFVLCPQIPCALQPGDPVIYRDLEDVVFGIQVGNSIVKGGVKTEAFLSRFYNIRRLEPIPFPPSLYPMDFDGARAARIALGADRNGKPMVLWAEGAAKFGHVPGKGSCGASLREMADICADVGMWNAVNLDGGGSAQLLFRGQRALCISDRSPKDHSETERPIPLALAVTDPGR